MAAKYFDLTMTPAVLAAQDRFTGRRYRLPSAGERDQLGPDEMAFIAARDSFYLGTVSETGWPYIQHRGGRPGFLRVTGPNSLAFADYTGNRQMLTTGNLAVSDRVSLFLMDYPNRERLKILGHARVEDARARPELANEFAEPGDRSLVERIVFIDVVAFDWNCPKYITPRYTGAQVQAAMDPLLRRIAELEAQLQQTTSRP